MVPISARQRETYADLSIQAQQHGAVMIIPTPTLGVWGKGELGSRVRMGGMSLRQVCQEETYTVCVGTRINI